jgi:hypothetical protein
MPGSKKPAVKEYAATYTAQQILCLFGPPPLLSTERRERFEQILAELVTAVTPTGAIEQMWIYDVAVLVWEMMRLRRYKAIRIERALPFRIHAVAYEFIRDDCKSYQFKDFADRYFRDPKLRQKLADALAESNLTTDLIDAEAFRADEIEKIELMLASLQARRDAIIREIGAYRDSLARQVKRVVDDIIEVTADDVEITPRLAPPVRKKSTAA